MSADEDPERPLTDQGRREVAAVGAALAARGVEVTSVLHSGKLRARQTAELLASVLGCADPSATISGLAPNDDPVATAGLLEGDRAGTMVVGHLPHLSRLVSTLIVRAPEEEIVTFRTAGVVCLRKGGEGGWRVAWMLTPEVVPS